MLGPRCGNHVGYFPSSCLRILATPVHCLGDEIEYPLGNPAQSSANPSRDVRETVGLMVTISRAENLPEPIIKTLFGRAKKDGGAPSSCFHVGVSSRIEGRTFASAITSSVSGSAAGCQWGTGRSDGEDVFLSIDAEHDPSKSMLHAEVWSDRTGRGGKDVLVGIGERPLHELLSARDPCGGDATQFIPMPLSLGGKSKGVIYVSAAVATGQPPPGESPAERDILDRQKSCETHEQSAPSSGRIERAAKDDESHVVVEGADNPQEEVQEDDDAVTTSAQLQADETQKARSPKWGISRVPDIRGTISASLQATRAAALKARQRETTGATGAKPGTTGRFSEESTRKQPKHLAVAGPQNADQPHDDPEGVENSGRSSLAGVDTQEKSRHGLAGLLGSRHGVQSLKDGLQTKVSRAIDISNDGHERRDEEEPKTTASKNASETELPLQDGAFDESLPQENTPSFFHGNGSTNEATNDAGETDATVVPEKKNNLQDPSSPLRSLLRVVTGNREGGGKGGQKGQPQHEEEEAPEANNVESNERTEPELPTDAPDASGPRSLTVSLKAATSSLLKTTLSSPTFTSTLKSFKRTVLKDGERDGTSLHPNTDDPGNTSNPTSGHESEIEAAHNTSLSKHTAESDRADSDGHREGTSNLSSAPNTILVTVFRASGLPENLTKGFFNRTKTTVTQTPYVRVKMCNQTVETPSVRCEDNACRWGRKNEGETIEIPLAPENLQEDGRKGVKLSVEVWNEESKNRKRDVLLGATEVPLDDWIDRKAAWADLDTKGNRGGRGRVKFSVAERNPRKGSEKEYEAGRPDQIDHAHGNEESTGLKEDMMIAKTESIAEITEDSKGSHGEHHDESDPQGASTTCAPGEDPNLRSPSSSTDSGVDNTQGNHRKARRSTDNSRGVGVPVLNLGLVSNKPQRDTGEEEHVAQAPLDTENTVGGTTNTCPISGREGAHDADDVVNFPAASVEDGGPVDDTVSTPTPTANFVVLVKEADALPALSKTTFGRAKKVATQNRYVTLSICGVHGVTSAVQDDGSTCEWPGLAGEPMNLRVPLADLHAEGWGQEGDAGPLVKLHVWNQVSAGRQEDIAVGSAEVRLGEIINRGAIWIDLSRKKQRQGRIKIEVTRSELQERDLVDRMCEKEDVGLVNRKSAEGRVEPEIVTNTGCTTSDSPGAHIDSEGRTSVRRESTDALSVTRKSSAREENNAPINVGMNVAKDEHGGLQDGKQLAAEQEVDLASKPIAHSEATSPAQLESTQYTDNEEHVERGSATVSEKEAPRPKSSSESNATVSATEGDVVGGERTGSESQIGALIPEAETDERPHPGQVNDNAAPLDLKATTAAPCKTEQDVPMVASSRTVTGVVSDSSRSDSGSDSHRPLQVARKHLPETSAVVPGSRRGSLEGARPKALGMHVDGDGNGEEGEDGIRRGIEDVRASQAAISDHNEAVETEKEMQRPKDGHTTGPMALSTAQSQEWLNKANIRRERARQIARRRRENGLTGTVRGRRITGQSPHVRVGGLSLSNAEPLLSRATATIQSAFRGRTVRRRLRLRRRAAVVIQAAFRGHRDRRVYLGTSARVKRAEIQERRARERRSRMTSMKQAC